MRNERQRSRGLPRQKVVGHRTFLGYAGKATVGSVRHHVNFQYLDCYITRFRRNWGLATANLDRKERERRQKVTPK
jgi:hypothetical protein